MLIAVVAVVVVIGGVIGVWVNRTPHPGKRQRHVTRDVAGVAGVAGVGFACQRCGALHSPEQVRRGLYLSQRSIGDYQALRRGRIGQRLVRRAVTKRLMKGLWGS